MYSLTALTLLKQPAFRADIGNAALAHDMLREMVHGFAPPALVKEAEAAAAASSADASVIANGTNGTAT